MYVSIPFIESGKFLWKLLIVSIFILCKTQPLIAQRFSFTQYNIEHGLTQSQARAFAQSPSRHLWIATQGGISRFDGSQFYSLTRSENGLASMAVSALVTDESGRIFIGTHDGLSVFDGKRIRNYRLADKEGFSRIHALIKNKKGEIYGLNNQQLFTFSQDKMISVKYSGIPDEPVTAIMFSPEGNLIAAVYGKGIYELTGRAWKLKTQLPEPSGSLKPFYVIQLFFDRNAKDKLWIVTHDKIFTFHNDQLKEFENDQLESETVKFLSIEQDESNNLWVGTLMGAYCISSKKTQFFNSLNGFTDNAVNKIFRDAENNMWFATEGAGIYKYDGDQTMILDKAQGLSNEVVMGFATDREGAMWMHCFGNTLFKLHSGNKIDIKLPVADSIHYSISHLFNDKDGNIWIGTNGAGLWKYDGKKFDTFPYQRGKVPKVIRHIMQDTHGIIWLATATGCYLLSDGKFSHLKKPDAFAGGLLEIGTDSVLVNTQRGNFLVTGKERRVQLIPRKELQRVDLYCMAAFKNKVFFGTGEDGIWIWDLERNTYQNLTRKNGLYSNTIYSLIADGKGNVWTGTGRGINKIKYNAKADRFTVSGAEYSKRITVECNQNAMFLDQNKLWVGTTKGAVIFDLNDSTTKKEKPYIVLQSVKLLTSEVNNKLESFSAANGFPLPQELELPFRKNHINLNFKGIYLTNPSDVLYQYRLVGLDDTFSNPTANSSVNYQTLPPGDYVFEARALNSAGIISDNMLRFPFSITPAFYQTVFFKLGIILFLVLSGIALQAYLHRRKNLRLQQIESMKREERLKARQQTAEDFHDDLGNKLTRISILTDILNMKLNGEHQEEKQLIHQIKENASSLYRGTKDILWALDPKSDNLYEILSHISEFGMELFQDTAIEFNYEGITEQLTNTMLPMEYSRNISMIFKEALNNSLRHAEAHHVFLKVSDLEKSIVISLKDDGNGFDQEHAHKGLGLNNIYLRAKRLGAGLDVCSAIGNGTNITLTIFKAS